MLFHFCFKKEYKEGKACDRRDNEIVMMLMMMMMMMMIIIIIIIIIITMHITGLSPCKGK